MQINFKDNVELNRDQMDKVLQTIAVVASWLANGEANLPDEGKMSLEVTLLKACNRLDAILDDGERWKLPKVDAHAVAVQHAAVQIEDARCSLAAKDFARKLATERLSGHEALEIAAEEEQPRKTTRRPRK